DKYKTCLGKYQSPIDIEDKDVRTASFPALEFSNIQRPHTAYMTNNGHTVMIASKDSDIPTISGGPLNDTYVFQQLHFHWGQNDDVGSEDLINNHSYSMELHAVFWKKTYGSSEEALKHSDGLTVLGYWYQATDEPNPIFESIVLQLPGIATVGKTTTINDVNILNKLIAPDIVTAEDYYTYKGSLTTPPCLEIVQWIDFIQSQMISHEQLALFRSIKSPDGRNLTHNYRPVQPLDDRIIYRNNNIGGTKISKPATVSTTSGTTNATMTTQTNVASTIQSSLSTSKPTSPPTFKPTSPSTSKPTSTSSTSATSGPSNTTRVPNGTVDTNMLGASTMFPKNEDQDQHSGQERIWNMSRLYLFCYICSISLSA
ncbi:Carbonic anhydrase 2, partial [Dufourea novaeangliae]